MNTAEDTVVEAIDGTNVAPQAVARWRRVAFIVGLAGAAVAAIGAFILREQFWSAYLLATIYWLQIALGCLGLAMLHHVAGGRWSGLIRRWMEAGAMTLPLLTVFCVPLFFGISTLYPWANPEIVQHSEVLQQKTAYLNVPFFVGRTIFYFLIWNGLALGLNRLSHAQDRTGDPQLATRMQRLSTVGLILYVLTCTFAAYDWLMSLEPEWYSSIYGLIFIAGQVLGALSVAVLGLRVLARRNAGAKAWVQGFNDLGNFILAFVMIWAYFSFSQFLIIWSANLPHEVTWYYRRLNGLWSVVALVLVLFDFAIPFLALLSRSFKRKAQLLSGLAVLILVGRWIELQWLIMPAFQPESVRLPWVDIALLVAIGGLWVSLFLRIWAGKAPLPLHDARLGEVNEHADGFTPAEQSA
ncbi:MAG: hypothetical protein IPK16_14685 [Anaerolineales bacterium]|nr:hypothetical protein [Anaerolineales bacterium]